MNRVLTIVVFFFIIICASFASPSKYDLDKVRDFLTVNKNLKACNLITANLGWHNLPYKDFITVDNIEDEKDGDQIITISGLEPEWTFKYQETIIINEPQNANGQIIISAPRSKKHFNTYVDVPGVVTFTLGDIKAKLYGTTKNGLVFIVKSQLFELISVDSNCTIKKF